MSTMNESEQQPVNNEVKLCLDDILTTLGGTIHQQQRPSFALVFAPPRTWTLPFLEDNIHLAYLVNSKETELRRTRDHGLSDPMSEGVYCEYCGDSDKHITDIRGGGGRDEICVQWDLDWDAEDPSPKPIGMAFYSCRSCFEDTEDPDLPIDSGICASCGIHNNLLGNEEETMMSQDYLEYREIRCAPGRGFCPHCVEVHTGSQLADAVIRRERYHEPEEIVEEIDESLRTAVGRALIRMTTPDLANAPVPTRRSLSAAAEMLGAHWQADDSFEDEIYLSDSVEDGGLADLEEQDNNGENVALEEALGRTEVEMFGPMGPGRHGSHIDRIECLETICGIVVLDAQNDRLMERLRAVMNILGIDVPGIYSLGDEEDPYDGELDLEEETEDNNEETAMSVKKTVQEMGELLFDIKDKITEGEYLKLMDGLQSITNEMNQ